MCHSGVSGPCVVCMSEQLPWARVAPIIPGPVKQPDHGQMCSSPGSPTRWKKHSGASEHTETTRSSSKSIRNDTYFCEKDIYVQIKTLTCLVDSCYFYEDMTSSGAKSKLKDCPVGRFIVRNSSDPNYLYTISVKTRKGPTSIRVLYERGKFSLDSDEKSRYSMPVFSSLLELIDYYVRLTAGKKEHCRFLDRSGKKDLPIIIDKPRLRKVPDLKSMCRTSINRLLPAKNPEGVSQRVDDLPLPKPLRSYLKDHPFIV